MSNLDKAIVAKAASDRRKRERQDEQVRDACARYPGASAVVIAEVLQSENPREKWTVPIVYRTSKRCGIRTGTKTIFSKAVEREPAAVEPQSSLLSWDVLTLFDKLVKHFDAEEDRDSEVDPRVTWIAWRVFLAAAFALPITRVLEGHEDVEYPGVGIPTVPRGAANVPKGASAEEIFSLCTGRASWPEVAAKIVALIVGRRGGKSYITAVIGIYLACCRRYLVKLGTKPMVMILARDREQAGVIRNYITAFLNSLDETRDEIANDIQQRIELKNGVTIEVRAIADSGAGTRGYTVVAVLADEIAFWPTDSTSKKQDRAVLKAIKPSTFGLRWRTATARGTGAMIILLSSPYARRGVLFEYWLTAYGKEPDEKRPVLAWQADTLSMRPEQDPDLVAEIEAEYDEDPENAKAEYGGQWRSDLEAIFSKEAIERVCVEGVYERPYVSSCSPYRAFVDPSGGSSDSYVVAVGHDEEREQIIGDKKETFTIPVLDKVLEWIPKFDPEVVSAEVAALCKAYKVATVTGDAYGGEWPRDPLKKRGIGYVVSEKTRSELYLDLLPVVNSGRCEMLDSKKHRRKVNQFVNLERRTGRSGKDAVDHPPGAHDDVSNAIAGVLVGTSQVQYRIRRPKIGKLPGQA